MIRVTDIHKSFGTLEVLKGVSLDVAQGEVVSIVGASGAGKTTLLQIIGTLSRPDGARIGPEVVRGPRPAHLAHEVPRTVGGKSRKKQPKQFFHVTGPFRSRGSDRRTW